MTTMETERLQKILASSGYGSRRTCERLIEEGRVTVDGKTATLGDQADPERQRIEVDGVPIARPQPRFYIMLNKPRGVISTTSDPQGRNTVLDLINLPRMRRGEQPRLYPVGRLDAESEGLILLTNDGSLTQHLTHPSYEHPRVYRVLVEGVPSEETLDRWQRGITMDGRLTSFDRVILEEDRREDAWLNITVHEGRKHLVRRVVSALGHPPKRLIRVAMGPLELGDLAAGKWRHLSYDEVRLLQREVQGKPGEGSQDARGVRPTGSRPPHNRPDTRRRSIPGSGSRPASGKRDPGGRRDPGRKRSTGGGRSSRG
jgi:23S rRNA pseudouridine2605 synthase